MNSKYIFNIIYIEYIIYTIYICYKTYIFNNIKYIFWTKEFDVSNIELSNYRTTWYIDDGNMLHHIEYIKFNILFPHVILCFYWSLIIKTIKIDFRKYSENIWQKILWWVKRAFEIDFPTEGTSSIFFLRRKIQFI